MTKVTSQALHKKNTEINEKKKKINESTNRNGDIHSKRIFKTSQNVKTNGGNL